MSHRLPSISTDQIASFVELARHGSLRAAGQALHLSEQGLRKRLLALETRLNVELYKKSQGMRATTPLTPQGKRLLPHAIAFLDRARELGRLFEADSTPQEVHVAASQYLIRYVLIDAVREFRLRFPKIRI